MLHVLDSPSNRLLKTATVEVLPIGVVAKIIHKQLTLKIGAFCHHNQTRIHYTSIGIKFLFLIVMDHSTRAILLIRFQLMERIYILEGQKIQFSISNFLIEPLDFTTLEK
jgi:hypothetical protein